MSNSQGYGRVRINDKTPVKKYSMGIKQKLGIAQAIMERQKILILDEPFKYKYKTS